MSGPTLNIIVLGRHLLGPQFVNSIIISPTTELQCVSFPRQKSKAHISNLLIAALKTISCPATKALIKLANQLDTGNVENGLNIKQLPYRDTSTRNISNVLGSGGFKLVLEDNGKALAVFRKQEVDDNPFPALYTNLQILQEILTSVLFSAQRASIPNFLQVDGIFRTQTCRRFFPENVVAFRMEKAVLTLDEVFSFFATPFDPTSRFPEVDQFFFQLFCALAYMHSVFDIYHLDLKPTNLLVTNSTAGNSKTAKVTFRYQLGDKYYSMSLPRPMSVLKICDLGSAMPGVQIYNDTISGTPVYRPPEYFFEGPFAPAGSCSDVFAAGLMMLQAYLGEPHDEFIMRELEAEDCIDDYLFDLVSDERICRMIYGYFVLFSTLEDIFLYRQDNKSEECWLADTGSTTIKFLSMIAESSFFFADWELFSIQCGKSKSMAELRRKICGGGAPAGVSDPRLNAFLSMVRIDPSDRATAAELAISPLFEHLEAVGENAGEKDVVCRLNQEIFG